MSTNPESLLPSNRSLLEEALEKGFNDLLAGVPCLYPALLDANNAPSHLLPYLAQEQSVPEWDSNDPVHIQRQVISKAWEVRRLAGTRAGLKLALQALDYDSEITPWYRMAVQAEPYTLEVLAWEKGNGPVDVDKAKRLISHLNETKSCRDTIELGLVFGVEAHLGVSAAVAPPTNIKETDVSAEVWPMPEASAYLTAVGVASRPINVRPLSLLAVIVPYEVLGHSAVSGGSCSLSISPIIARAIT